MDTNNLMAQAQAILIAITAIQVGLMIFGAWVVYMFYARLRDIADELRIIRITYQMDHERKAQPPSPQRSSH